MLFDETSAVSNVKVKESFEVLMEAIYNEQSKVSNKKPDAENSGVSLTAAPAQQKKTCCI